MRPDKHSEKRPGTGIGRFSTPFICVFIGVLICFGCAETYAANFDIKPIKVSFNARTKAEKLSVTNVSEDDLTIQVTAFKWSQDNEGKDIYEKTSDIVVFPKVLKIPKGEERIIRIGTNAKPDTRERTYRVYVEEIPIETKKEEGATLRIAMKFGIPVFVGPVKGEGEVSIESLDVKKGNAAVKVRNNGNAHLIITSVKIAGKNEQGAESFTRELGGWYLLSGASRTYETDIPDKACARTTKLSVTVKTTKNSMQKNLGVTKDMCSTLGR